MVKGNGVSGVYSATYSGIPVYEFIFGPELKESVMRRRQDDWINATHILKAAGFDKPSRTRILEREVQKDTHEKIQGGYGKYQGTWIPLEHGRALAQRNNVYDKLHPIFEYVPGGQSPPPAPRHTSKPKQPKRPAVPKWNKPVPAAPVVQPDYDAMSLGNDDDTPDNLTVASASYMGEDDRFDTIHSTGHRKRKREETMQDITEQEHSVYGNELLDYFLLSKDEKASRQLVRPEPPTNFQPDRGIDTDGHTALHWACAMGDVDVVKQLKRFGAGLDVRNVRGETPFMHAVNFTNCYEKNTFPQIMKEVFSTVGMRDDLGWTVIHHAATTRNERITGQSCSRFYLEHILNKLMQTHEPAFVQQIIDAQDNDGNTAIHLAAKRNARKCIRSLIGRQASTDIANNEGIRAEDLIMELNAKLKERPPQPSSSPFGPDSQYRTAFRDAFPDKFGKKSGPSSFRSDAANTIQSRITPLVLEKIQDLAQGYEDGWADMDVSEKEARQSLSNTQAELHMVQQQIAEAEAQLLPDEEITKLMNEVARAKYDVQGVINQTSRIEVQKMVDEERSMQNGDVQEEPFEARFDLARQLYGLLSEQKQAEIDYVEALSMVGTGEKIDQYRRLLRRCLDPKDADSLDSNLDNVIEMMEEERDMSDLGTLPDSHMAVDMPAS